MVCFREESMSIERYREAQKNAYDTALQEIRNGEKISCRMEFIFPQAKLPGCSAMEEGYAVESAAEAREYLDDPVLGSRLREISEELLKLPGDDPEELFGSEEAGKLKSSMTLFAMTADDPDVFLKVLRKYFDGEKCEETAVFLSRIPELI